MPSLTERRRNNLRAGIFMSVALLLAMGVLMILGDFMHVLGKSNSYTVQYSIASGVDYLTTGSVVRVGGLERGRVQDVEFQSRLNDNDSASSFDRINVTFSLDEDVTLYADPVIRVVGPLLGADSWLEITDLGGKNDPKAIALESGATIQGNEGGGQLAKLLGPDGPQITAKLSELLGEIQRIAAEFDSEGVNNIIAKADSIDVDSINELIQRLNDASGDVRQVVANIREDYSRWSGHVDDISVWAVDATEQLDNLLVEGQTFLDSGTGVIDENREALRTALANIAETSENVKHIAQEVRESDIVVAVETMLSSGQEGLAQAKDVLTNIERDYPKWSTDVGESLGSLRQASLQAELALMEVRRSPWKILHQPSEFELEHELLYEATRSFAYAAADLTAASESVQKMLDEHGDELEADPELLNRLKAALIDPLARYEAAQKELFETIRSER